MKNRGSGFTLIELLITITVLAILATIALPSLQAYIVNARVTAQANDFLAALHLARSEAVKRNAPVSVNAKDGDWANGWEIVDAGGNVLRDFAALKGGNALGGDSSITFQPNGQAGAATFSLCSPDSGLDPGRDISVDISGRSAVSKPGTCS